MLRFRRSAVLAVPACAAVLLLAGCGGGDGGGEEATPAPAGQAQEEAGGARVEVLASGLEVPWDVAFLPDGRALLTERPGRIRLLAADGTLAEEPVAEVPVQAAGEGGLLGIDVDPEFASGRRFAYVYVTTADGVEVQRWRMGADDSLALDGVVLDGITAGPIHDSGRLRFGPDGALHVATGDAGDGRLAQDRGSPNGKLLRLGPAEYRGSTGAPDVVALGLRNPQGLAFQPGSGRLWLTDHGPSGFDGPSGDDEVNVVREGANFGWPAVRGTDHGDFAAPAFVWEETVAPSGAAFVRDGPWAGDLLVAALRGTALMRLDVEGERVRGESRAIGDAYGRLRAVVPAPDGTLWVTTSNRDGYGEPVAEDDDRLLRVTPPG